MGNYSVPENIRKLKPTGTMVKVIKGKYYVYEQKHIKDDNNKWKIKMGKLIGSIDSVIGFIPNNNFEASDKITTVDFGEYFLANSLSIDVYNKLKSVFNPKDATNIYNLALIHFVNGFTYIKNVRPLYNQSYLSIKYNSLSLSEYIVSNMLDDLGRKQERVHKFEDLLISESSKELAVDGHAIKSSSHDNSLAEDGNKTNIFRDKQINLLMAYDINTNRPVLSRMYDGAALDNISVKDLFERRDFRNTLFIIDKGFYSSENINLLSKNGNKYIIPLKANTKHYREIAKDTKCESLFVYERGKKKTAIEYREAVIDGVKVMIFRDQTESAIESADYLSKIGDEKGVYTIEAYNTHKEYFGTIILESNLDKTPEEIYKLYKRRWQIETFYDYYKNRLDVNALHLPDYYQTQGLSFIMLITSLIHSEFVRHTKGIRNMSVSDMLIDARFIKLHLKKNEWKMENVCKRHIDLFNSLGISLTNEISNFNKLYGAIK